VVEWKTVLRKKSSRLGLLIMSKGIEPSVGISL